MIYNVGAQNSTNLQYFQRDRIENLTVKLINGFKSILAFTENSSCLGLFQVIQSQDRDEVNDSVSETIVQYLFYS